MGRTETLMKFTAAKPQITYITEQQLNRLLPFVKDAKYKYLIGLCFWTGLRYGETLLLTEADIVGKSLNVSKQLDKASEERLPKNKKIRRVYLDEEAEFWLEKWLSIPLDTRKKMIAAF